MNKLLQKKEWDQEIKELAEFINRGFGKRAEEQSFNRDNWSKSGKSKIQGLSIPQREGGRGLNALESSQILETLAYYCEDGGFCFALAAHLLACSMPLYLYGSDELKSKYLTKMCDGSLIAANAITEAQSGSDVFEMNTTAVKEGDYYILNGHKIYITNAPVSDVVVIYAMTNPIKGFFGGITAFLLDQSLHNYELTSRENKFGLKAVMMGQVILNDVKVHKSHVIGQEGGGGRIFNTSMIWEKTCLSGVHLGSMKRLFSQTRDFLKSRKLGNHRLSSHQVIQHKMSELYALIVSSEAVLYNAASRLDENPNADLSASTSKMIISENYKRFASDLIHLYGAKAFVDNHPAALLMADSVASTIYSGTSEIQKNIISKHLGII